MYEIKRVDIHTRKDGRVIVHGENGEPLSDENDELEDVVETMEQRRLLLKNAKYFADEELSKCKEKSK